MEIIMKIEDNGVLERIAKALEEIAGKPSCGCGGHDAAPTGPLEQLHAEVLEPVIEHANEVLEGRKVAVGEESEKILAMLKRSNVDVSGLDTDAKIADFAFGYFGDELHAAGISPLGDLGSRVAQVEKMNDDAGIAPLNEAAKGSALEAWDPFTDSNMKGRYDKRLIQIMQDALTERGVTLTGKETGKELHQRCLDLVEPEEQQEEAPAEVPVEQEEQQQPEAMRVVTLEDVKEAAKAYFARRVAGGMDKAAASERTKQCVAAIGGADKTDNVAPDKLPALLDAFEANWAPNETEEGF